jgi:hypothetical protein
VTTAPWFVQDPRARRFVSTALGVGSSGEPKKRDRAAGPQVADRRSQSKTLSAQIRSDQSPLSPGAYVDQTTRYSPRPSLKRPIAAPATASVYGPEVARSGPAGTAADVDKRSEEADGGASKMVTLSGSRAGGAVEPGLEAVQRRTLHVAIPEGSLISVGSQTTRNE